MLGGQLAMAVADAARVDSGLQQRPVFTEEVAREGDDVAVDVGAKEVANVFCRCSEAPIPLPGDDMRAAKAIDELPSFGLLVEDDELSRKLSHLFWFDAIFVDHHSEAVVVVEPVHLGNVVDNFAATVEREAISPRRHFVNVVVKRRRQPLAELDFEIAHAAPPGGRRIVHIRMVDRFLEFECAVTGQKDDRCR